MLRMGDQVILPLPPQLDQLDRRILYELDFNSRRSLGVIARKVRCSKQTLHYRIQRLVKEGVITGFITSIDTAKLGYSMYIVWIEMSGISLEKKQAFLDHLIGHPNIQWVASCGGKYDVAIQIAARNVREFSPIFKDIQNRFPGCIKNHTINLVYEYHRFSKKFLTGKDEEAGELFNIGGGAAAQVDEADVALLSMLSKDSRAEILELSSGSGLSPNTVRSRMKRMEETGIIKAYTISLQEAKIGIERRHVLLSLHNMSPEMEQKLESFCMHRKESSFLLKVIGKWDAYVILDPPGRDELQKFLTDLRSGFDQIIKDFELAAVLEDLKFDYYPMGEGNQAGN